MSYIKSHFVSTGTELQLRNFLMQPPLCSSVSLSLFSSSYLYIDSREYYICLHSCLFYLKYHPDFSHGFISCVVSQIRGCTLRSLGLSSGRARWTGSGPVFPLLQVSSVQEHLQFTKLLFFHVDHVFSHRDQRICKATSKMFGPICILGTQIWFCTHQLNANCTEVQNFLHHFLKAFVFP